MDIYTSSLRPPFACVSSYLDRTGTAFGKRQFEMADGHQYHHWHIFYFAITWLCAVVFLVEASAWHRPAISACQL